MGENNYGVFRRAVNFVYDKKYLGQVKKTFGDFSKENNLDGILSEENKTFVKDLFLAMYKSKYVSNAYDRLAELIASGGLALGTAYIPIKFFCDEMVFQPPLGDMDLFTGLTFGAIAGLGVVAGYNAIKSYGYNEMSKKFRNDIDSNINEANKVAAANEYYAANGIDPGSASSGENGKIVPFTGNQLDGDTPDDDYTPDGNSHELGD